MAKTVWSGLLLILLAAGLSGCMSTKHVLGKVPSSTEIDLDKASGGGRYTILQDRGPDDEVSVQGLAEPVPRWEPKSRGGNKSPYEVWGKKYWVMDSAEGYVKTGTASWYGKKFHGHKTSNGETYDMYQYSAAHKTLPLPTYLKVTNLDNGRSVIVRVNDRGPFHDDRLIDLSYAAAMKLDYHKKGLARVKIEAITPKPGEAPSVTSTALSTTPAVPAAPIPAVASLPASATPAVDKNIVTEFNHLQIGAFSSSESADRLKLKLVETFDTEIKVRVIMQEERLYKVLVGPYVQENEMNQWINRLQEKGFGKPVRVALLPGT